MKLARLPSVADYQRMTAQARKSAALLAADRIRLIEERRANLTLITRPRMHAADMTADEVRLAATVLARIYDTKHPEPLAAKTKRAADLEAALESIRAERTTQHRSAS